jgi:hypothetical protein
MTDGGNDMPPSGFSQKAIEGLLEFVSANYISTLSEYASQKEHLSEREFLEESATMLESKIMHTTLRSPLEADDIGIRGLVRFITECYRDLAHEIYQGRDRYGRAVTDGEAIRKEIDQIRDYLSGFSI